MTHALRIWWLSMRIDAHKHQIETIQESMAVAAQYRDVLCRRLAALEIQLIDLEHYDA